MSPIIKYLQQISALCLLFILSLSIQAVEPVRSNTVAAVYTEQGMTAFQRGRFAQAIEKWEASASYYQKTGNLFANVNLQLKLAAAYQSLGHYPHALERLETTLGEVDQDIANGGVGAERLKLALTSHLGLAYTLARLPGRVRIAGDYLNQALKIAKSIDDPLAMALITNNLGNLMLSDQQPQPALNHYQQALEYAVTAKAVDLQARIAINAAQAALQLDQVALAGQLAERVSHRLPKIQDEYFEAQLLLMLGDIEVARLQRLPAAQAASLAQRSLRIYTSAQRQAQRLQDQRLESEALGRMAKLYALQQQSDDMRTLLGQAKTLAQRVQATDLLYQWQWLEAQYLKQTGQLTAAAAEYQRSINTLQSIRYELSRGGGNRLAPESFRDDTGQLFFELADVLLQQASQAQRERQPAVAIRERLVAARDTVELLKSAELSNYFQDDCVARTQAQQRDVAELDDNTSVIYLVPLQDRTEIIYSTRDGLQLETVPVTRKALMQEVNNFRKYLEHRGTHAYRRPAKRLYRWLIEPLEAVFAEQNINTLIFVPDGALRTVPMGALFDGKQFLIEKYAIGVTPGLMLVDPQPLQRGTVKLLMSGLAKGREDLTPLPFVPDELATLKSLYGGRTLLNEDFRTSQFAEAMAEQSYNIVHIASHAEFKKNVEDSYLAAYDGNLDLDRLEGALRPTNFRDQPVDLLALSACQTAAGDDRAALGLAGVAIKAGARSALASLWFVNDAATSQLITRFYRQLKTDVTLSKAQALQQAKQALINDKQYDHPFYWAPFLMIGNWL